MTLKLTTLACALALTATSVLAEDGTVVSKASDSITIKGDLRLRHEGREVDSGGVDTTRNRLRHRFRLGIDFKTAYGWNISAGLATGSNDPTSTNQTWDTFDTGDIRLDYAYAKHTFGENTVLTLGQQKNPLVTADILWDSDVRPTGAFLQQKVGKGFLTAGYMNIGYGGSPAMAEMLVAQAGVKIAGGTAAASYYVANSQVPEDLYGFGPGTEYEFKYLDFYADYGFDPSERISLSAFGEYGVNVGAEGTDTQMAVGGDPVPPGYEADDHNSFFTIGVKAKIDKKVSLKLQFVRIEGDGVFGGLNNSDFGDGIDTGAGNIDVQGYIIGASYSLTKNCSIGVTILDAEGIVRDDEEVTLRQIDLVYKF